MNKEQTVQRATFTLGATLLIAGSIFATPDAAWAAKNKQAPKPEAYQQLENDFSDSQVKYRELAQRLEQTIEEAQGRFQHLRATKVTLEKEVGTVQKEVTRLRLQHAKREEELLEQEKLMSELEKRLTDVTGKLPTYESALQSARQARDLKTELNSLQKDYDLVKKETQALAGESLSTIKDLQTALTKAQSESLASSQVAATLKAEIAATQSTLKDESQLRRKTEEELALLKTDFGKMTGTFDANLRELARAEKSEGTLRKALRGSELTIANLSTTLETTESNAKRLSKQEKEYVRSTVRLESDLKSERSEREELETIVTQQEKELRSLRTNLADASKKRDEAVADARSSFDMLESFLLRLERLMNDLERARKSMPSPTT